MLEVFQALTLILLDSAVDWSRPAARADAVRHYRERIEGMTWTGSTPEDAQLRLEKFARKLADYETGTMKRRPRLRTRAAHPPAPLR